jgi:hypothetical protein
VQVDVAPVVTGVNWREKKLLLGECKWGTKPVGRSGIRELIETKTPLVRAALPEEGVS